MTVLTTQARRLKRRRRVRAKVSGSADAPADLRVPLEPGDLGAARRRPRRAHARRPSAGPRPSSGRCRAARAPSAPGELLAERAKAAGITAAVFDRGGYQYHGHVKALAEGAREAGLTV